MSPLTLCVHLKSQSLISTALQLVTRPQRPLESMTLSERGSKAYTGFFNITEPTKHAPLFASIPVSEEPG